MQQWLEAGDVAIATAFDILEQQADELDDAKRRAR